MSSNTFGSDPDQRPQDEDVVIAECVDSESAVEAVVMQSFHRKPQSVRGPRLWLLAWIMAACVFSALVVCFVMIAKFDQGEHALRISAVLLVGGVLISIAGFIWPRYVDERRCWIAPLLALVVNLGLAGLFLVTLFIFTFRDEIRQAARERAVAQQRARIQRQRERAEERRVQQKRAEQQRILEEQRRRAREIEQRQARLETFASGAADDLGGKEVIHYRDDPSTADSTPLKLIHEVQFENAQLSYFDEEFGEAAFAPTNGRVYVLRAPELLAIDPIRRQIVRRLKLPHEGRNLVVTSSGPVLRCGRRLLLVDWELRPIRSAPGTRLDGFIGHPRSPLISIAQEGHKEQRIVGLNVEEMEQSESTLGRLQGPSLRLAAYDDPANDSLTMMVATAGERMHRWSLDGAEKRWLPSIDEVPLDRRPEVNEQVEIFGPRSFAVRCVDESTRQAQIVVYSADLRPRLTALISEQTPPDSSDMLVVARGSRVYLRQSPSRILTTVPGTNHFETFTLESIPGSHVGPIERMVALENAVWIQTTRLIAILQHEEFPAQATRDIVFAPPLQAPARAEDIDLPEVEWRSRQPAMPLQSLPLVGGFVEKVEQRGSSMQYHLSRPVPSAVYDTRDQRLLANVKDFGLVAIDPADVRPRLAAALPDPFARYRLATVGGHIVLAGDREFALIGEQWQQLVPFKGAVYGRGRTILFHNDGAAFDWWSGQTYGTLTRENRIRQIEELGFDREITYNHSLIDFVVDRSSETWMYLIHSEELFRAKLPAPGTDRPWKLEHVMRLADKPLRAIAFPNHLMTQSGRGRRTTRIYQTSPDPQLVYERDDVGDTIAGLGNTFYMARYEHRHETQLVIFDAAAGKTREIPVGSRSITYFAMVPFPGGIMLCSTETPLIVKMPDEPGS